MPPSYGSTNTIVKRTGTTADSLGISDTEYQDMLDKLLDQASRKIDDFCSRKFYKIEGFTEVRTGNRSKIISTNNYPIITINQIKENDSVLSSDRYELVQSGNPLGNSGRIRKLNGIWSASRIEIDYDYGYEETPSAIEGIAEDMVIRVVNEANAEVKASGSDSISMDGYSIQFGTVSAEEKIRITESEREKLKPYKRINLG